MTSPDHRNCSERSNEVCQRLKADFIVEIQGDEPTLETDDLDRFVTKALEYSHFDVATQYTEITEEQANDPQNVKVVVGPDSRALFFSRCPIPYNFKSKHPTYFKQVGAFYLAGRIHRAFQQTAGGLFGKHRGHSHAAAGRASFRHRDGSYRQVHRRG